MLIAAFTLLAFSELCFSVTGMSLVTKRVPARLMSTYMGMWFVSVGIAGKLSGLLSSCFHVTSGIEQTKTMTMNALLCFMILSFLGICLCGFSRKYLRYRGK
jgi:dipeptide/tripeptide permease